MKAKTTTSSTNITMSTSKLRAKHHRYDRQISARRPNQNVAEALASDASELLYRWLVHHRREQQASSVTHRRCGSNLPEVITTGGRVWKRSEANRLVYEDASSPSRLLHVVPDDEDSESQAPPPTKALRCPPALGYVGRPLPVAPSLPTIPQQRYLVRPRLPVEL